jgi:dihydropteroate synthase
MKFWHTSRRKLVLDQPLVMGILNVTPDSFSDGGSFQSVESAVEHAEQMIADGADIIDIGGESTRPGSQQVSANEEARRVIPVIEALVNRFDCPISIDTTKTEVARSAIDAGAEIINDISGLRWDETIADLVAASGAGLVLMHSRGTFETMHSLEAVDDIVAEVKNGLHESIKIAQRRGVGDDQIALDVGIGLGKTQEQNLELIAKLDKIVDEFKGYAMLIGTSRKSFIKAILGDVPPSERLSGSLATAVQAVGKGANIVRVHDVKETVAALRSNGVI